MGNGASTDDPKTTQPEVNKSAEDGRQVAKHEIMIEVNPSLEIENFNNETIKVQDNLKALGALAVESVFDPDLKVIDPPSIGGLAENGFITAVRTAYSSHVPLTFSPDHIWTLIAQGISIHISKNAEKFRGLFVDFDGKQTLKVIRDGFTKGSQKNDWAGCFEEFSGQIEGFVGKERKAQLCPDFSSTTAVAKACHELGLMDCMKSYFEYQVHTRCGIKQVKLQGSVDDWKKLEASLDILSELDLTEWGNVLKPILNNLTRAADGEATDKHFWDVIYKAHLGGGSGAHPTVDGWVTNFFLYINDKKRQSNEFRSLESLYEDATSEKRRRAFHNPGVPIKAIPVGLSKTPFLWVYLGKEIEMSFFGGFVGAKMEGEYVSPVLGWAVGEKRDPPPTKAKNRYNRW